MKTESCLKLNCIKVAVILFLINCFFSKSVSSQQRPVSQNGSKASQQQSDDAIVGKIPEPKPDMAPGTRVFVHIGKDVHSCWEFAEIAMRRISAEEGKPVPEGAHVAIHINPDETNSFSQVIIGTHLGGPGWIVTISRELKVTKYKRSMVRG
jgi:hypothetical protein